MKKVGAELCFLSEENAWEEKQAEIKLSKIVDLRTCYHRSLIHLDDLTFDFVDFPRTFTKFRKLVEKDWYIRSLKKLPLSIPEDSYAQSKIPTLEDLDSTKTFTAVGHTLILKVELIGVIKEFMNGFGKEMCFKL